MKVTKLKLREGIGLDAFSFLQSNRFDVTFDPNGVFTVKDNTRNQTIYTTMHNVIWFQVEEQPAAPVVATEVTAKSKK